MKKQIASVVEALTLLVTSLVALVLAIGLELKGTPAADEDVDPPAKPKKGKAPVEDADPPAKPKKGKKATAEEITMEELRTIARPLVKDGRGGEIKEMLEEFDATTITDLDEEHYAAVKEKLEEMALA
jgi:hypothetical protein